LTPSKPSSAASLRPSSLPRGIEAVSLLPIASILRQIFNSKAEVASSVGEFAQTIADLALSDIGQSLSHSLNALVDLERKAQELESAQAQADLVTFMATADEYARLINSVRVRRLTPSRPVRFPELRPD
jgi:hypothetical protein